MLGGYFQGVGKADSLRLSPARAERGVSFVFKRSCKLHGRRQRSVPLPELSLNLVLHADPPLSDLQQISHARHLALHLGLRLPLAFLLPQLTFAIG